MDQLESHSSPHTGDEDTLTPISGSEDAQIKGRRRGYKNSRSLSTTTLHRWDVSPAPSSSFTKRSDQSSRIDELRFRVVCPQRLVGAIIGRGGENIRQLRQQTNADIVIEDPVVGCEDRIMSIIMRNTKDHVLENGSNTGDALVAVFDALCQSGVDVNTALDRNEEASSAMDEDSSLDSPGEKETIPVVMYKESHPGGHNHQDGMNCQLRLLIDASQTGFVVGKQGAAIKGLQESSGAQIVLTSKAELPACAWVSDEMVRITGSHTCVSTAIRALARILESHPPRVRIGSSRGSSKSGSGSRHSRLLVAQACSCDLQYTYPTTAYAYYNPTTMIATTPMYPTTSYQVPNEPQQQEMVVETVFRLLVPSQRVGQIIGRNGDHVQRIRRETGARIKIYGPEAEDTEERLVCIWSAEDIGAQPYCAAQDALVRCAIALSTGEDFINGQYSVRLLTPQVSVGAVLGKRGITVMRLRQETGAAIRMLPVEVHLAAAAAAAYGGGEAGGDEIIHIEGFLQQCVAALRGVATLLRGWQVRRFLEAGSVAPMQPSAASSLSPHAAPYVAHGAHPATPEPVVLMPVAGAGAAASLVHHQYGAPFYPAAVQPPNVPHQVNSTTAAANSSILWRYRLSNAQAGAVIGKAGHHVTQIRFISGARVYIPADPSPDGTRPLEISGSYEACQTAHAMVNQFLALAACLPALPEHTTGIAAASQALLPSVREESMNGNGASMECSSTRSTRSEEINEDSLLR